MPLYDCGSPDCEECQRAFGPNRSKAIAAFHEREKFMALSYDEMQAAIAARRAKQEAA